MARRASPRSRTISPRFGAGTSRHVLKASVAAAATRSYAAGLASMTVAIGSPVVGLNEVSLWPSGSLIQPSGPVQTPGFMGLSPSVSRRAACVVGIPLFCPTSGARKQTVARSE